MELSTQEETLIKAVRALPEGETAKIITWAMRLSDLAQGREIEWFDSWSDEDLADASAASFRRFEEQEREDLPS